MNSETSRQALSLFIFCNGINTSVLLTDAVLAKLNFPTLTDICKTTIPVGIIAVGFQCLFPLLLGIHFYK